MSRANLKRSPQTPMNQRMSFTDAIGQVDQILQLEQQLGSGSSLSGAATGGVSPTGARSSATDAATSSNGTSSTTAANFADALAQAQYAGDSSLLSSDDTTDTTDSADSADLLSGGDSQLLTALSALNSASSTSAGTADAADTAADSAIPTTDAAATGSLSSTSASTSALIAALESALESSSASGSTGSTGTATSADDPRIQAMLQEANSLVGEPYVWGGGHSGWGTQSGYDCSGFVSAVLHAGGYLSSPQDTATLPTAAGIESGPGQYVTIYDRDESGAQGHVIIDLNGQFYESGGEQGSWGGGGGVEKISTPSAAYLSSFNVILHPEGL